MHIQKSTSNKYQILSVKKRAETDLEVRQTTV